jgi:hypothetical protein
LDQPLEGQALKLVYEVAFVAPAVEGQQLEGIKLQLCNEADAFDTDFRGRAKVSSRMQRRCGLGDGFKTAVKQHSHSWQ